MTRTWLATATQAGNRLRDFDWQTDGHIVWYSYDNSDSPQGAYMLVAVPEGEEPSETNIEPMFVNNPAFPDGPTHILHRFRRSCVCRYSIKE